MPDSSASPPHPQDDLVGLVPRLFVKVRGPSFRGLKSVVRPAHTPSLGLHEHFAQQGQFMHFVAENGDDRLVAGQDVRMDPERDLAILVEMIPPIDSAVLMLRDPWAPCRLESSAGEVSLQASLQLP